MAAASVPGTPKGDENQGQRPPSHTLSADDKAAKVAALSQALDIIDKYRKSQESKEDKTGGPDEAEINDLATNLQEASQGASTKSNKSFHFGAGKKPIKYSPKTPKKRTYFTKKTTLQKR